MEEQINQLKNALREVVSLIIQRGQPLSEDLRVLLVQVFEHVAERIQQLRAQEEAPITPTTPEVEPAPFESAQVRAFKYDPKSQDLYVKFQDKFPQTNGPVYRYSNVPKFIYDVFSRGAVGPKTTGRNAWHAWKKDVMPSLGAALNALIKAGGYQYQRLS